MGMSFASSHVHVPVCGVKFEYTGLLGPSWPVSVISAPGQQEPREVLGALDRTSV